MGFIVAAAVSLRASRPLVASRMRGQATRSFQSTASRWKKAKKDPDILTETVMNVHKADKRAIGRIIDERITHRWVRVASDARNSEASNRASPLPEPQRLASILAGLDKKDYYVLLVSDNPEPIVKIISKKEDYEKEKAAKKASRVAALNNMEKEVHITWGAAPGDTQHKLDKAREYMGKGWKVHILFMYKKGQSVPSKQGMVDRVQAVVDHFQDVATEYRPRDHRFSMAACFLKGKAAPPKQGPPPVLRPNEPKLSHADISHHYDLPDNQQQ